MMTVTNVQRALNRVVPGTPIEVCGLFTEETTERLKAFQKQHNARFRHTTEELLREDGKCDEPTAAALQAALDRQPPTKETHV